MRSGTPGFQAERLVEARDSPGPHTGGVAELINRTSSSISRWEGGGQSPEPEALGALARALNLPIAFFLRPLPDHGPAPMFFRSMASTTQSVRKRTQARLRWAQDIGLCLQEWVDLPEVKVPSLDVTDHRESGRRHRADGERMPRPVGPGHWPDFRRSARSRERRDRGCQSGNRLPSRWTAYRTGRRRTVALTC